jgi:hypothetical protein
MKPLPLLLAASLVANAIFFATKWYHPAVTTSPLATGPGPIAAHAAAPTPAHSAPSVPANLAEALEANNPDSIRDFLRAAGLPETTIRSLVTSLIWDRYFLQASALHVSRPDQPWWKAGLDNDQDPAARRERRTESRRLLREAQDTTTRVLGPGAETPFSMLHSTPHLGFLSETKRNNVQEIERDYEDLTQAVGHDMQGFKLPADEEKLKFIADEKRRDLAALLTPQELVDYDLRTSPTAKELRPKVTQFDGSEEEYRKLFTLQKAYDDSRALNSGGRADRKKRQEDEKQLQAQFKTALGPQRYADYQLSQNGEYQTLIAATQRLALPVETARQVFDLRTTVSSESVRIMDSPDLAAAQKKQALADLAQRTRAQIVGRLGEAVTDVYIKNNAGWLESVGEGCAFTIDEEYNIESFRSP